METEYDIKKDEKELFSVLYSSSVTLNISCTDIILSYYQPLNLLAQISYLRWLFCATVPYRVSWLKMRKFPMRKDDLCILSTFRYFVFRCACAQAFHIHILNIYFQQRQEVNGSVHCRKICMTIISFLHTVRCLLVLGCKAIMRAEMFRSYTFS